jgi:hypothetical protein
MHAHTHVRTPLCFDWVPFSVVADIRKRKNGGEADGELDKRSFGGGGGGGGSGSGTGSFRRSGSGMSEPFLGGAGGGSGSSGGTDSSSGNNADDWNISGVSNVSC